MGGILEHLPYTAPFHDGTHIHHCHVVRQLTDHAHIMGNEHDGRVVLSLQFFHQFKNLGLDCHIQGSGGLVGNEHLGAAAHGHGDHGPLAHTAGELMGVLVNALLRGGDPHLCQQLQRPGTAGSFVQVRMVLQILPDLESDGVDRVEGGHRVLKDHGYVPAAEGAHFLAVAGQLIDPNVTLLAVVGDGPALNAGELGQKLHDGRGRHALAAARLPHHTEGPSLIKFEGDAVENLVAPLVGVKIGSQILDGDDGLLFHIAPSLIPAGWGRWNRAVRRRCS